MIFVPAFLNWEKRRNIFFNDCNNVRDSKKNAKNKRKKRPGSGNRNKYPPVPAQKRGKKKQRFFRSVPRPYRKREQKRDFFRI